MDDITVHCLPIKYMSLENGTMYRILYENSSFLRWEGKGRDHTLTGDIFLINVLQSNACLFTAREALWCLKRKDEEHKMLYEKSCKICGGTDMHVIDRRTYYACCAVDLPAYEQKRYKVLFEIWFPGEEEVTLESVSCTTCGFVCYFPRPDEGDMDAKYRYLEILGQDYGTSPPDADVEHRRSAAIYSYVNRYVASANIGSVLDYGGGDGRLMHAFRHSGAQCNLIDYNKNCIESVTRLGDTVDVLDRNQTFDLVVCSHVIEHVPAPRQLLEQLAAHLSDDGVLFIEVPMEIWRRAPLQNEPVTHINFFTPASLANLALLAGMTISDCRLCACLHPSSAWHHGVRCILRKTAGTPGGDHPHLRSPDVDAYLRPTVLDAIRYYRANFRGVTPAVYDRIRAGVKLFS